MSTLQTRSVLIAGAGYVAQPVGDILAREGVSVIYGCRNIQTAQKTAGAVGARASAIELDVRNAEQLSTAVSKVDLVVSLVPATDHTYVVEAAIKHKKNVLTTSYISPELAAMGPRIKEAGIIVFNELGLDPGLDHLWAVKCLDSIVEQGGKCTSFESYCGGLPAPECSDNALGYRFSWSSAGVMRTLSRVAKYVDNGVELEKSGADLMATAKPFISPFKGFALECYANGDSLPYRHRYPGMTDAATIVRGTLRYTGFCDTARALIHAGFVDQEAKDFLTSAIPWNEASAKLLGAAGTSEAELVRAIKAKHSFRNADEEAYVVRTLRQMGVFSTTPVVPQKDPSPFYTTCALLEQQGAYGPDQRDMVFLQHAFHMEKKDGSKSIVTATLVEYGTPGGYSAMAKLVGVPAAVGCLAVLRDQITDRGLVSPMEERIAKPLRETLRDEYGIKLIETEVDV